ncbi:unnamed protein product [Cuscuta campestris]|uniref:glucan endo-1,3-beta-D-glucosidase n=1 Tax=Cuscuta campestris TaxID=132261 RepID=A0A484N405_9ASTE|nr:unnamed protein product [Cuscuta campestris]
MAIAASSLSGPLLLLLFSLVISDLLTGSHAGIGVGINYGQIADNLPSHSSVVTLLQSLNIKRVKLYDADPDVLEAFSGSDVEFVVGLGNEYLQKMTDPAQAQAWVQQNIQPHVGKTKITCITVGNEVVTGTDLQARSSLLPAMKSVRNALVNLGLEKEISVNTAHAYSAMAVSFPPSAGAFKPELVETIRGILDFNAETNAPFLVNAYPYFAYKADPAGVPLDYVLFRSNRGTTDPAANLKYDNMLYAQIDAVYSAIKALGHTDVQVKVSETGWPSKGDEGEAGASRENAAAYNGNLLRRIAKGEGTPANPSVPVDVYIFALFNENLKPGPTSERNYGLYYPDRSPVYDIKLQQPDGGVIPEMEYSAASDHRVQSIPVFLLIFMLYSIHVW